MQPANYTSGAITCHKCQNETMVTLRFGCQEELRKEERTLVARMAATDRGFRGWNSENKNPDLAAEELRTLILQQDF